MPSASGWPAASRPSTSEGFGRGTHALVFTVSDYQEAKNMENVTRILPNTRVLRATIRVP